MILSLILYASKSVQYKKKPEKLIIDSMITSNKRIFWIFIKQRIEDNQFYIKNDVLVKSMQHQ